MRRNGLKQTLCLLITAAMLCILPASGVFAENTAPKSGWDWDSEGHYDISWYSRDKAEFYLSTAEELAGLAWIVNQGQNLKLPGEAAGQREAFTGKTVYLKNDIYLNDHASTGEDLSAHQWPSIGGGKYTVNNNGVFNGTFDGQGHSIYNLYIHNLTAWTEYDARNRGLFGVTAENAIIQNLYLRDGYIRAARSTGGIVGKTGYLNVSEDPSSKTGFDVKLSGHGTMIQNCHNVNTTVITTDSKGVGGIVGACWNYAVIQNCSNSGNISSVGNYPAGGIAGENEYIIENCWNTGAIASKGNNAGGIAGSNKLAISSIANSYNTGKITGVYAGGLAGYQVGKAENCYNAGSVTGEYAGGLFGELASGESNKNLYFLSTRTASGAGSDSSGKAVLSSRSAEAMKADEFMAELSGSGNSFAKDTGSVNGGYPVIAGQKEAEATVSGKFTDVPPSIWYFKAVDFVTGKGLFTGVGSTLFGPDQTMTRGMFVTVLGRMAGADTGAYAAGSFPDVKPGEWYASYVQWANDNKLVGGTGNGFSPDGKVTREQIALILYRYAQFKGADTTGANDSVLTAFQDRSILTGQSREALIWAVDKGIVSGIDGYLRPTGNATRAQVAQMILRFSENVVSK